MKIKLPNFKRTHEYIKRLANLENVTFGLIAKRFGKDTATAEAWARIPESVENPDGNGKRNPIDGDLRVIAMAHEENGGLAREIAEIGLDYCDYLDARKGRIFAELGGCVNDLCGESMQEHTDIVVKMLRNPNPNWNDIYTEIQQALSKLLELKACVKEKIRNEIKEEAGFGAINLNQSNSGSKVRIN